MVAQLVVVWLDGGTSRGVCLLFPKTLKVDVTKGEENMTL